MKLLIFSDILIFRVFRRESLHKFFYNELGVLVAVFGVFVGCWGWLGWVCLGARLVWLVVSVALQGTPLPL
jgi:hypothetical protein